MGPGVEELGFMGLEHFNTNTGRQLDSPISTSLWPRVRPIHRGSLRLLRREGVSRGILGLMGFWV